MALIFQSKPGVAAVYEPGGGSVSTIKFDNESPWGDGVAIITAVSVNRNIAAQFTQTIGDSIHVYSFGEMMGDIVVAGSLFDRTCGSEDGAESAWAGVKFVDDWFSDNSINKRGAGEAVTLVLGSKPYEGYVVGVNYGIDDPVTSVGRFQVALKLIPESAKSGGGRTPLVAPKPGKRLDIALPRTPLIAPRPGG